MAKAKKLPSGSWRCLVYDYTDDNGKRKYKSFTCDDPSSKGKREVECQAAQYAADKSEAARKRNSRSLMTLREAIDDYINTKDSTLSETTIYGYRNIQKVAFVDIMDMRLKDITKEELIRAVNEEAKRKPYWKPNANCISAKTVHNEYGLICSVINRYNAKIDTRIELPRKVKKIKDLPEPKDIFEIIKGTRIELPCLLAMWLSFSSSEVRGLKRSSIHGEYLQIDQVVTNAGKDIIEKELAKVDTRTRRHHIPPYIMTLIDQLPPEQEYLVPLSGNAIYKAFIRLVEPCGIKMTFHDLRHMNASVMAYLQIPDKYAMERGGWSSDKVMKSVYTHTFSQERITVDDKVDTFFEGIISDKPASISYEKFLDLLKLNDTKDTKKLYVIYTMQHEMQHES